MTHLTDRPSDAPQNANVLKDSRETERESGQRSPLYNNSFLSFVVYERPNEIVQNLMNQNKQRFRQTTVRSQAGTRNNRQKKTHTHRKIKNKRKYETILYCILCWGKLLQLKAAGNWQTMRDP